MPCRRLFVSILGLVALAQMVPLEAQQLGPGRRGHLPTNTLVASMAYLYADGQIFLNLVLMFSTDQS